MSNPQEERESSTRDSAVSWASRRIPADSRSQDNYDSKRSFNADSENIRGIASMGFQALALYYGTAEAKEGGEAFREKRKPRFREKLISG